MTDALAVDLLPKQNSTPYELALLGAMIKAWPIDPAEVARQSDPMRCDSDKLVWLAFDRGLTVWSDDWPEDRRRRYVRDAWIYLRLQGSPLGVEALRGDIAVRRFQPRKAADGKERHQEVDADHDAEAPQGDRQNLASGQFSRHRCAPLIGAPRR